MSGDISFSFAFAFAFSVAVAVVCLIFIGFFFGFLLQFYCRILPLILHGYGVNAFFAFYVLVLFTQKSNSCKNKNANALLFKIVCESVFYGQNFAIFI